jgi:hypothetical protein
VCSSPQLIAAYHVLRRLLEPRHPPCALICFKTIQIFKSLTSLKVTRYYNFIPNMSKSSYRTPSPAFPRSLASRQVPTRYSQMCRSRTRRSPSLPRLRITSSSFKRTVNNSLLPTACFPPPLQTLPLGFGPPAVLCGAIVFEPGQCPGTRPMSWNDLRSFWPVVLAGRSARSFGRVWRISESNR